METFTVEPLNLVGQLAALIGAVVLIIVAPVEMILYGRPWVARFLKVETSNGADVRLWSFCIGARNAIGAAGALLGLYWIHSGQAALGTVLGQRAGDRGLQHPAGGGAGGGDLMPAH